jgi:hypothetical protein
MNAASTDFSRTKNALTHILIEYHTVRTKVWYPIFMLLPLVDTVGELGDVGPTPPRGRDKSGPYALAIAALGLFLAIRQQDLVAVVNRPSLI